jgi:hypothetical protein
MRLAHDPHAPRREAGAAHALSPDVRVGQVSLVGSIEENLVRAMLEA